MGCEDTIEWFDINEDSTFVLLARTQNTIGAKAVRNDITSITAAVYDITDGTDQQVGTTATLDKTIVFTDAYVTNDPIWKKDSSGYDFKWKSIVRDAGHQYRVDITFIFGNGDEQKPKFYLRAK